MIALLLYAQVVSPAHFVEKWVDQVSEVARVHTVDGLGYRRFIRETTRVTATSRVRR